MIIQFSFLTEFKKLNENLRDIHQMLCLLARFAHESNHITRGDRHPDAGYAQDMLEETYITTPDNSIQCCRTCEHHYEGTCNMDEGCYTEGDNPNTHRCGLYIPRTDFVPNPNCGKASV